MTQLPPSLHTSVNSERSNQRLDATAMSGALEPWSHPWHALQRTLAFARRLKQDLQAQGMPTLLLRDGDSLTFRDLQARSGQAPGEFAHVPVAG